MSDNEFFSANNIQYPPDMVGELAELAYKYNVSNTMQTNIVVSFSVGTTVDVLIIDLQKDVDESFLYRRHVYGSDYAGIAAMLADVKKIIKTLYKEAGV